jgi:hypothetical protein
MTRPYRVYRHGVAAAVLAPGILLAGCAPPSSTKQAAWDRYVEAESAYEDCRATPHRAPPPCRAEKAAYEAAREHYETGDAPPPAGH